MFTVTEINDLAALAGYRDAWAELLAKTPGATLLHTPDWLELYWRHFGADQRLRVLAIRRTGRVVGILPLVVRRESTRLGSVRVLTYPLHDWGTFYGPIGPDPHAALAAGLAHVRNTPRDWDLLDFRWVDRQGSDQGATPAAMRQAGFRPSEEPWARAAIVRCQGSWADYWRGRPRKWRENVRRDYRHILAAGPVEHVRYRPLGRAYGDGNPRWDLYEACVEVSRASWQADSPSGTTLCHDAVRDFLRDAHGLAAQLGACDLNLLFFRGRPVAFAYNYFWQGAVLGLRRGYDAREAPRGAGGVLEWLMLKDSFRRCDRLVDLGIGSLAQKRHVKTDEVTSFRYTHFPLRPRTALLGAKRWLAARRRGADYTHVAEK